MKTGIKYIRNAGFGYVYLKNHYCPKCSKKLQVRYESKAVSSKDTKEYDLSLGDSFLAGDIEIREKCFFCPVCKTYISFKDIKKYEKTMRKK